MPGMTRTFGGAGCLIAKAAPGRPDSPLSLPAQPANMAPSFTREVSPLITQEPMNSRERRAVASLALLYNVRMIGLFMVLPLLALYATDLVGASPLTIGLALGIYGLSQALLQIPLGWLSDRVGRKPVIIAGLLVFVAGSLVAAMATSIEGVIVGRALQGAGAIAGTVMAMLADLTREEQRTKGMAVVGASIGLAFTLALVLGPLVAGLGGLSAVFYFTAVLATAGLLLVLFVVPTPTATGTSYDEVGTRGGLLLRGLKDRELLRLDIGIFVLHFALTASFLAIPGLLENGMGLPRDNHWQVYLGVVLLSVPGVVVLLRWAERGGRPRPAFTLSVLLVALGLLLLPLLPGAAGICLALWVFFVGFNYLEASLPSLVSKTVFEGGKGTALGIFSTFQFLGIFAGGVAGGWLMQHGGATALFLTCLGLVIAWLLSGLPRFATPPMAAEQDAQRL